MLSLTTEFENDNNPTKYKVMFNIDYVAAHVKNENKNNLTYNEEICLSRTNGHVQD